jgi:hypothetical protein
MSALSALLQQAMQQQAGSQYDQITSQGRRGATLGSGPDAGWQQVDMGNNQLYLVNPATQEVKRAPVMVDQSQGAGGEGAGGMPGMAGTGGAYDAWGLAPSKDSFVDKAAGLVPLVGGGLVLGGGLGLLGGLGGSGAAAGGAAGTAAAEGAALGSGLTAGAGGAAGLTPGAAGAAGITAAAPAGTALAPGFFAAEGVGAAGAAGALGAGSGAGGGAVTGADAGTALAPTGGALSTLGAIAPAALGVIGSNQQANAYGDLAGQYMAMGAPYRSRLSELYNNPDEYLNSDEVQVPVQQATNVLARSLSRQGNPAGSGNALQELQNYAASLLFGKLGQEKDRLAGFGGLSAYNQAAPGAAGSEIGARKGIYDALGAGAADIFNPPKRYSLEDLYRMN